MLPQKLHQWFEKIKPKYPHLTEENFGRILLLFHGLNYQQQTSFPDHFTHFELLFTAPRISSLGILNMFNPNSPFVLIDGGKPGEHILLFENQFVDTITDYEQRLFDFRKEEPFYFYVTEVTGDLVLKLNPVQLCDFFLNSQGEQPCGFCFRNDTVKRFKNIDADALIKKILIEEKKKDNYKTLSSIDEISIVTGSYRNDDEYLGQISKLVQGLKAHVPPNTRVVVGSHEGKGHDMFKKLQQAGVTVFAFPVESLDKDIRKKQMNNRKGQISVAETIANIKTGIDVFGPDGVIIRLVAGMGDQIDDQFRARIAEITRYSPQGIPFFNINQYMPFTHYHWHLFQKNRPYDLEYMFQFCDTMNSMIPLERQVRFKVSP